jgi:ADP-heptose:LPS heptosyltransferase
MEAPPGIRRIGLVWAGRGRHWRDRERSMPIEMLAPLASVENVKFFSLQKGNAADRVDGLEMIHLGPDLKTFMDTAAVIAQLDLIITVDTAVAHLAGAMAKPVWNLLGGFTDFRWMLDREDTPWYPTMRLFRQARRGDWEDTMARVVKALTSEMQG